MLRSVDPNRRGLQAKGSVGLITPDVPDEYVLLARCIVAPRVLAWLTLESDG
jgi:hypothetical protein